MQIERIATEDDTENGVACLSSIEVANVNFSSDFMTQQASQATQVRHYFPAAALYFQPQTLLPCRCNSSGLLRELTNKL